MGLREVTEHSRVSEKVIEAYLVDRAKDLGGIALKYYNTSQVGFPDRLLILPNKPVVWIELKSAGKGLRKIQELRHELLKRLGQRVYVADSKDKIDKIIDEQYNSRKPTKD